MLSEHNEFLERAYRILNKVYFEDKLPEAVITIQSSQRAYGHITVGKVWQDNWDSYHEINILLSSTLGAPSLSCIRQIK